MKKLAIPTIMLCFVISGCVSNDGPKYRWVQDTEKMLKVEKKMAHTSSSNKSYWVHPPKKKVLVEEKDK